jgi:hypothetical protein
MGLFKRNKPFGHIPLQRNGYLIFEPLNTEDTEGLMNCKIEGLEIIRNFTDTNVLFISNHQTYFADVVKYMFHVFTVSPVEGTIQLKMCAISGNLK